VWQYLQCGLLVAASDTSGQREAAAACPQGIRIYRSGDAASLAELLNDWIARMPELAAVRMDIYEEANTRFAYERQSERLLASVECAIAQ
jgi:hypothetical protein